MCTAILVERRESQVLVEARGTATVSPSEPLDRSKHLAWKFTWRNAGVVDATKEKSYTVFMATTDRDAK